MKKCSVCGSVEFVPRGMKTCLSCNSKSLKKGRYVIGIDPDVEKSGFAVWDIQEQKLTTVESLPFFDIFDRLQPIKKDIALVRIEAGWLNLKSNFHYRHGQTRAAGEKISKNVGSNHEAGKKLIEMCNYLKLNVEEVRPLGSKQFDSQTFKNYTGWQKRTNQDNRDAGILVFKYK